MSVGTYSLAREGDKLLSPHFRVREFACRDGADLVKIDPRRIAEGKNPFQLDSPAPDTDKLMDFLMGENRFASLKNNFPERADALYQKEIADVKARYQKYRKMAED